MRTQHLAFLIPGNYTADRPGEGLEQTLRLFEFGERLGYDGAWVRQRHLEPGISSAAVFLAAASRRTRRVELGIAVIQMRYENPFRLAEDLATRDAVIVSAAGQLRPRLHPVANGLTERLWHGAGSRRSAAWAGQHGFQLLSGNIVAGEGTDRFEEAQLRVIETFRANWSGAGEPRVALGRVIVPLDGADAAARRRCRGYAESRSARTQGPQGERRTLFAPDIVGKAERIVEAVARDPVLREATELRLELPCNFAFEDYEQILADVSRLVAPSLSDSLPAGRHTTGRTPVPVEATARC